MNGRFNTWEYKVMYSHGTKPFFYRFLKLEISISLDWKLAICYLDFNLGPEFLNSRCYGFWVKTFLPYIQIQGFSVCFKISFPANLVLYFNMYPSGSTFVLLNCCTPIMTIIIVCLIFLILWDINEICVHNFRGLRKVLRRDSGEDRPDLRGKKTSLCGAC